MNTNRPYLIIPELIEQPTWGGDYILKLKQWDTLPAFIGKKIGQSYELTGRSKVSTDVTDSTQPYFDAPSLSLPELHDELSSIVGPLVQQRFQGMPLLIKLNQAAGNSFQLHLKPGQTHARWKPKPESWYFLENGYISCGLEENRSLQQYKQTCVNIADKMRELSGQVHSSQKTIDQAREEARIFIQKQNPWQYIQRHHVKKHDLIDLSQGGIHHSWEENREEYPLGNIVYEVQIDVMDEFCTIRSFDQGKMKDDGTIREIHIDDYFTYLDSAPESNRFENVKRTRKGKNLLNTSYYALDILEIDSTEKQSISNSFHHLYVQEGEVEVWGGDGMVRITQGHSCFVPYFLNNYEIRSKKNGSVVLKTYIA
jgi:mannose-6-phosphate isomerase class I